MLARERRRGRGARLARERRRGRGARQARERREEGVLGRLGRGGRVGRGRGSSSEKIPQWDGGTDSTSR
jgi:hypothetical protein